MTTYLSCRHKAIYDEDYLIKNAKMCTWEEYVVDEEFDGYNSATAWGTICNECLHWHRKDYTILARQTMYGCVD